MTSANSVPVEYLNKSKKLSEPEMQLVRTHAQAGFEIVSPIEFPWPIADMVHQHHERLDGSGYPEGLQGDQIIVGARILAVADVVEAMSSHRPYRSALGIEAALEEIQQNRGRLYDADVVDACVAIFADQDYELPSAQ